MPTSKQVFSSANTAIREWRGRLSGQLPLKMRLDSCLPASPKVSWISWSITPRASNPITQRPCISDSTKPASRTLTTMSPKFRSRHRFQRLAYLRLSLDAQPGEVVFRQSTRHHRCYPSRHSVHRDRTGEDVPDPGRRRLLAYVGRLCPRLAIKSMARKTMDRLKERSGVRGSTAGSLKLREGL